MVAFVPADRRLRREGLSPTRPPSETCRSNRSKEFRCERCSDAQALDLLQSQVLHLAPAMLGASVAFLLVVVVAKKAGIELTMSKMLILDLPLNLEEGK